MQILVLVGILLDLLIKRKVSRGYLADKYEMSPRTITRYVDTLGKAGIPVISRLGIGGGYYLEDGYKIDRLLFDDAERARIAAALNATLHNFGDDLNQKILDKLT
ncbi:MAG: HTH domain-containing protein [Firmicutes bacterium]|nr:HTH domain-containing protein [Bacillota bacterium]